MSERSDQLMERIEQINRELAELESRPNIELEDAESIRRTRLQVERTNLQEQLVAEIQQEQADDSTPDLSIETIGKDEIRARISAYENGNTVENEAEIIRLRNEIIEIQERYGARDENGQLRTDGNGNVILQEQQINEVMIRRSQLRDVAANRGNVEVSEREQDVLPVLRELEQLENTPGVDGENVYASEVYSKLQDYRSQLESLRSVNQARERMEQIRTRMFIIRAEANILDDKNDPNSERRNQLDSEREALQKEFEALNQGPNREDNLSPDIERMIQVRNEMILNRREWDKLNEENDPNSERRNQLDSERDRLQQEFERLSKNDTRSADNAREEQRLVNIIAELENLYTKRVNQKSTQAKDEKSDAGKPNDEKSDAGKSDEEKTDEKEPDVGKPDAGKPEEEKTEEEKSEEKKPDEEKPDEGKPDEEKPDEEKPDDEKPDAGKPDEEKPDEEKPDEEKPDEEKPDEEKPEEEPEQEYVKLGFFKRLALNVILFMKKLCKEDGKMAETLSRWENQIKNSATPLPAGKDKDKSESKHKKARKIRKDRKAKETEQEEKSTEQAKEDTDSKRDVTPRDFEEPQSEAEEQFASMPIWKIMDDEWLYKKVESRQDPLLNKRMKSIREKLKEEELDEERTKQIMQDKVIPKTVENDPEYSIAVDILRRNVVANAYKKGVELVDKDGKRKSLENIYTELQLVFAKQKTSEVSRKAAQQQQQGAKKGNDQKDADHGER